MNKYFLKEDIKSNRAPFLIYGKMGDLVEEVGIHGNIIIVKNESGERYTVHIDKLQIKSNENSNPVNKLPEGVEKGPTAQLRKKAPSKPKKGQGNDYGSSLFPGS